RTRLGEAAARADGGLVVELNEGGTHAAGVYDGVRTSVAAAAGAAAATATAAGRAAERRLLARADCREDRELAPDVRAAAIGAGRLLAIPDELLEMRLALHADVLVD